MTRLKQTMSRVSEIVNLMDTDELNILGAELLIEELQEYLVAEFDDSYRTVLDDDFDDALLLASVYAAVGGETFADRIERYVAESTSTDTLKQAIETLATTDGHRVREEAKIAAGTDAERLGYTVTKTWRSVKIPTTRDTHFGLDGVTIPINEYFETANGKALCPGGFGNAEEDVNCLCWLDVKIS